MASPEDHRKFEEWTGFLPKRRETTPYHSGPHSIRNFEMAYLLAGKPKRVLEIGFCLGHSSAIFLNLGVEDMISIESSDRPETLFASRLMYRKFGDKFSFSKPSQSLEQDLINATWSPGFDMIFIDGDHSVEAVDRDAAFAVGVNCPFILFDDWFTHWSEGTQPAVAKHRLVPIAILGSMALCVPAKNLT